MKKCAVLLSFVLAAAGCGPSDTGGGGSGGDGGGAAGTGGSGGTVDLCMDVDCNDDDDCTADVCDPADGSCSNDDEMDGTSCDFDGAAGVCMSGVCEDAMLCDGVDCDDANECTMDLCDPLDGSCNNPGTNEGGTCDASGDPGTCQSGTCVGLCDGIDCSDGNECTDDVCDPADGNCSNPDRADGVTCDFQGVGGVCNAGVCEDAMLCDGIDCSDGNECTADACDPADGNCSNPDEPAGTDCQQDGGSVCTGTGVCVECILDDQCPSGEMCVDLTCVPSAIDPDPQSATLTVGCTNNVTADISILPFTLDVDPSAIIGGAIVPVDLDGVAEFSEVFLDAAQGAVPGGVKEADLINLAATVLLRTGGTLPANTTLTNDPIPATCLIPPSPSCDPANDGPSVPGSRSNSDCVPVGTFNPCQQLVTLPTSDDCSVGGVCDLIGKGPGTSQCDVNGFCVTSGLPLPLADQSTNFQAAASGTADFGWDDQNTGATLDTDGTYILPGAVFTDPPTPNEIKVNAGGLSVALRCTMAVDSGDPTDGVGVPDLASPTPDELLISFDIQ